MTRWGFFKARKSGAALPELGEKDAPELEEIEMLAESTAKSREKKTVLATRWGVSIRRSVKSWSDMG